MTIETAAKEPLALIVRGGKGDKVVAWACGKCGIVRHTEDLAALCCDPEERKRQDAERNAEFDRKRAVTEAKRRATAKRVEYAETDRMVYLEGTGNDGYHDGMDDFLDWCATYDERAPFLEPFACTSHPVQLNGIDTLIEQACDDAYEGAADDLRHEPGMEEIEKAIDAFNKRCTLRSYDVDHSRVVIVHDAEWHARNLNTTPAP